jgi:hypothetical protein
MDQDRIDSSVRESLAGYDTDRLRSIYEDQGSLLVVDEFVPKRILESLLCSIEDVRGEIHRSYVPGQKKGGSVSRHSLDRLAPVYRALYESAPLRRFLEQITGDSLKACPPTDPHAYALYCYTEPGDHIGWHYDTSFYRGRRYTLLVGLIQNAGCKLECELHRDDPTRATAIRSYTLSPGTLVLFDGDRLWHKVTPLAKGEERIALTMEMVTDPTMSPWRRLISNVKDATAYFGFREVFFGPRQHGLDH